MFFLSHLIGQNLSHGSKSQSESVFCLSCFLYDWVLGKITEPKFDRLPGGGKSRGKRRVQLPSMKFTTEGVIKQYLNSFNTSRTL